MIYAVHGLSSAHFLMSEVWVMFVPVSNEHIEGMILVCTLIFIVILVSVYLDWLVGSSRQICWEHRSSRIWSQQWANF